MRVGIIGAGASGLVSARHISYQGFECEVYEMGEVLGGTWVYTDDVGVDKFGFPVHSAMYQNLTTNLPKEIMGFPDFPNPVDESFPTQKSVLQFLNSYADHFRLKKLIKFNQMVIEVRPFGTNQWQIKSIHKPTRTETTKFFDAVMVCNGHYHTPIVPKLPGEENFNGTITHSFQYRSPESYKNKQVLIVGAGPSGREIALQISTVAKEVVIASKKNFQGKYPSNVWIKPEVSNIRNGKEVVFSDGSSGSFDTILLCTGYTYNFPFLHSSCGITVEDRFISPLYKHMINIERPTMCFIGMPFHACLFLMFDVQARFFCHYLNGSMVLPSKDLMYKDMEENLEKIKAKGYTKSRYHMLSDYQQTYFEDLTTLAKTTPVMPVFFKIYKENVATTHKDITNFRTYKYRIVNNDTFVKIN